MSHDRWFQLRDTKWDGKWAFIECEAGVDDMGHFVCDETPLFHFTEAQVPWLIENLTNIVAQLKEDWV